jgi:hypothetical protein
MNTRRQALYQAVLARISLGAVPVDGVYWFDPKDARAAAPAPDAGRSAVSASWPQALGRLRWFESAE